MTRSTLLPVEEVTETLLAYDKLLHKFCVVGRSTRITDVSLIDC